MIIRCQCGTDTRITTNADQAVLTNLDWYDAESQEVRCPKCKNNILPIIVAGPPREDGSVPLILDIHRPVELTRIKS